MSDLDPVENREARLAVQKVAAASKPGPWPTTPEIEAEKLRKIQLDDGERVLRSLGENIQRKLGEHGQLEDAEWLAFTCYLLRFR